MRAPTPFSLFLTLGAVVLSSQSDSWQSPPFEVRHLEKRGDQYIINPCPEFLGLPKQKCGQSPCGKDTVRGICDNIRLNGLQDQRCRNSGGCGDYCLCVPQPDARYAQVAPARPIQFIGIMCPEQYGLPKFKCSDPKCGGDSQYPGYCDKILVSGAQGAGCRSPGCGVYCDCDNSPGPSASNSVTLTANTTWVSGTDTLYSSTFDSTAPVSTTQQSSTFSSFVPSISGSSSTVIGGATSSVPSSFPSATSRISGTSAASFQSDGDGVTLITQSTGPIWEPTVAPGPTTSGGMIVPIIPIIPIVPPPAGFVPPPPGTPEPSEQCPADYQETKCEECGREFGWCQQPPNAGCPCQEACTTGDDMPDCNDNQCEGQDSKCTIGPQKDCECKPDCPTGIDGPRCDDSDCEGSSEGQCTTGQYAGCDCIRSGTLIAESADYSWALVQQRILNLMAVNAPNGAYSSLLNATTSTLMPNTSTRTSASMGSMTTRLSNSSALTASSAMITNTSQTCWTVRSKTICLVPEATFIDSHTTTEMLTTTLSSGAPSATTTATPTCYTVRSYTLCVVPEVTVLNGQTITEMLTTTLGANSTQSATQSSTQSSTSSPVVTSTAIPLQSSIPSPVVTSSAKPTGPMYGIYIAIKSDTLLIPGPNGFGPQPFTVYTDLIYATAAPAGAPPDPTPVAPQYCETKGIFSSSTITKLPTDNPPYPLASFTSLRPSGTSGPSCDWVPSLVLGDPGYLVCDQGPTSLECENPAQAAMTCGSYDTTVQPLVQCIWQGA